MEAKQNTLSHRKNKSEKQKNKIPNFSLKHNPHI